MKSFFCVFIFAVFSAYAVLGRHHVPAQNSNVVVAPTASAAIETKNGAHPPAERDSGRSGAVVGNAAPDASGSRAESLRSLESCALLLSEAVKPGHDAKSLVAELVKNAAGPIVSHQRNDLTGDLTIVRTDNPPEGTRYFHAQYFGRGGEAYLQHVSFEFEPGPTAMSDAVAAIEKSFGVSRARAERHGESLQWEAGDGYIVSVRRLEAGDLGPNPYNAYSSSDVGTVQVTLEIDQDENES